MILLENMKFGVAKTLGIELKFQENGVCYMVVALSASSCCCNHRQCA